MLGFSPGLYNSDTSSSLNSVMKSAILMWTAFARPAAPATFKTRLFSIAEWRASLVF